MPPEPTNLVDILLSIFGVVIAGFAVGGAVQAWRTWSNYRRIGTWVVMLTSPGDIVAAQPTPL